MGSTTVVLLALPLTGPREDDAVVSHPGRFAPSVAVSLASSRDGEPATELHLVAIKHHERGRYSSVRRARPLSSSVTCRSPDDVLRALLAFANTLDGTLVLGVATSDAT